MRGNADSSTMIPATGAMLRWLVLLCGTLLLVGTHGCESRKEVQRNRQSPTNRGDNAPRHSVQALVFNTPDPDFQDRQAIVATVQTYLDEEGTASASEVRATCGSELGALSVSCDPEAEARISGFAERTSIAINMWSGVGTIPLFRDGSTRFSLFVDVEGLSDATRIMHDSEHRARNQQIREIYERFVREFGPPVDARPNPSLNERLACIRGYEILTRLRGAIQRVRQSPAPHDTPNLSIRCTKSAQRGPDHRGASIYAQVRFVVPLEEGNRVMGRFQTAGFQPN